jgi:hypothetical protein
MKKNLHKRKNIPVAKGSLHWETASLVFPTDKSTDCLETSKHLMESSPSINLFDSKGKSAHKTPSFHTVA